MSRTPEKYIWLVANLKRPLTGKAIEAGTISVQDESCCLSHGDPRMQITVVCKFSSSLSTWARCLALKAATSLAMASSAVADEIL